MTVSKPGDIEDFALKRFLNDRAGPRVRYNLSSSVCEPLTVDDLLVLEDGAARGLAQLSLGYPGLHGSASLRALIAGRCAGLGADDILVTTGADDAIALLLLSSVAPGDHVVVHAPGYQPFAALARWRGCAVSPWNAREEAGWALDLDELVGLLTPRTRLIVVIMPHNPTGYLMPEPTFADLLCLTEERGITVVSDEIYAGVAADPAAELSPAASLSPRAVSLGGLSKSFGLPGLRVGWIATADRALLDRARRVRMHANSFASGPSEYLAAIALRHSTAILARNRAIARDNLAAVAAFIDGHRDLLAWRAPRAGVLAFPRLLGPETADQFCASILAGAGILLAPSPLFGYGDRHIRVGFGLKNVPAALAALDRYPLVSLVHERLADSARRHGDE